MMKQTLRVLPMIAVLLTVANVARAEDDRLTVTQDESSMELTIQRYLQTRHNLVVDSKILKDSKDDIYLELLFAGKPMPKYRIYIDSQSLNRDKLSSRTIERGVQINLFTNVKVPRERRVAVLEAINDFNRRKAFAAVYVDADGEINCGWMLNVLEQGLATENVFDAVSRLDTLWRELYPEVASALSE
jgi:hypothetical protein